ncbi:MULTISPECIES: post-transcriptional regulator [Gracilibacillus]|uniref:Post-transcriptional regulator n=1 Tax=Gracilibacillus dipsosauri TaxID=178340 RepID=A0A317KXX3_9BACI|nr:post-transcriptional regulator [Gracilibacillus dipsosauri]PWU68371.1 hypothetical protein DLJ74_07935 [Gracilibacillus dipsosauri]
MCVSKQVSAWKQDLQGVLESKVHEFHMLEYHKTTKDDIWNCLTEKVWKGDPEKKLFEAVQDVLHLNANTYMSYLTMQSFKDTNLQESIKALFGE